MREEQGDAAPIPALPTDILRELRNVVTERGRVVHEPAGAIIGHDGYSVQCPFCIEQVLALELRLRALVPSSQPETPTAYPWRALASGAIGCIRHNSRSPHVLLALADRLQEALDADLQQRTAALPVVQDEAEPQIRVIEHGPTVIERARQWQREHAAANTPTPDETYLLVRDMLIALMQDEAELLPSQLPEIVAAMRHDRSRFREAVGGSEVVTASKVDEWADEIDAWCKAAALGASRPSPADYQKEKSMTDQQLLSLCNSGDVSDYGGSLTLLPDSLGRTLQDRIRLLIERADREAHLAVLLREKLHEVAGAEIASSVNVE